MIKQLYKPIYLLLLLVIINPLWAQSSAKNSQQDLVRFIDSLINKCHQDNLFPSISASFYYQDSVYHFNKGLAKIETTISSSEEIKFQLGSIGKLLTSIAVLQQVEKGNLNLHTDINTYLGTQALDFSFKEKPVTLHCLLTHSCGFNDINIGYMAKNSNELLPLAQYITQSNPDLFQVPGTEANYSNYSFALAGLIVEKITNISFQDYVNKHIFNVLGMHNSSLQFPEGYENDTNYATAYQIKNGKFSPVQIYPRHAIPAGSLVSNAIDMGIFIKALFQKSDTLLSKESWALFYQNQFTKYPLLNSYAYGLEEQQINGIKSWAKGGMLPGALSGILLIPDEFAFFYTTNTSDDRFGEYFFKTLFDQFSPNNIPTKSKVENSSIAHFAGEYRDKRYNRNAAENIISLFRGAFYVYSNATDDTLVIHHNGQFHSYVEVEKNTFQNTTLPYEYIIFESDKNGAISYVYRNLNIGGLSIPVSYEKTSWYNSPSFVNEQYAIILVMIFSGVLFLLFSFFIRLIRLRKKEFWKTKLLPNWFHLIFATILTLFFVQTYLGPFHLVKNVQEYLFGYPANFTAAKNIAYLILLLSLGFGVVLFKIWREQSGSLFSRIYTSIWGIAILVHLFFLSYWSFI